MWSKPTRERDNRLDIQLRIHDPLPAARPARYLPSENQRTTPSHPGRTTANCPTIRRFGGRAARLLKLCQLACGMQSYRQCRSEKSTLGAVRAFADDAVFALATYRQSCARGFCVPGSSCLRMAIQGDTLCAAFAEPYRIAAHIALTNLRVPNRAIKSCCTWPIPICDKFHQPR